VLETLEYIRHETDCWLELTTLLIPGENDSESELNDMTRWVVEHLGPDVPMHFTAFHPDWKMRDIERTPAATLTMARDIARSNGVRHAYTGNVHDPAGASTWCHNCGELLIERDWHRLGRWGLDSKGQCTACGSALPGHFDGTPQHLEVRPVRVRMR
jgi:pyruvate formate lyase activating enzyme